ncbi:hypothetical protein CDAR_481751 [Caerostris darwini]|uniref:Uncharacterized protein n=1 Tax=Caerostris darwini TaxID=1538125 RepID=A0AAV4UX81_9ARAC|nr:hypothetical protein CDAR_481751 [Caerostris darwini]
MEGGKRRRARNREDHPPSTISPRNVRIDSASWIFSRMLSAELERASRRLFSAFLDAASQVRKSSAVKQKTRGKRENDEVDAMIHTNFLMRDSIDPFQGPWTSQIGFIHSLLNCQLFLIIS